MNRPNFRSVNFITYGPDSLKNLEIILASKRNSETPKVAYFIDCYFEGKALMEELYIQSGDFVQIIDSTDEPKTSLVDKYTNSVRTNLNGLPAAIVAVGGGCAMDYAKAVGIMLTNPGKSEEYQGTDLVKNPSIFTITIPTIAGTGAEITKTAVLSGPVKKFGINSIYTVPEQVILDPRLPETVPTRQWFYTGMDCYIHNVECLKGGRANVMSDAYCHASQDLCRKVFLSPRENSVEEIEMLQTASYFGGFSVTYSLVGVCHAMSYGLSFALETHHCEANCLIMPHLGRFYPEAVREFEEMLKIHDLDLPQGITANATDEQFETMADIALGLDFMWEHHFGPDWKNCIDREEVIGIFKKI